MIYAGHESPAFEPVDFSALVGEMLELLKVAISRRVNLKANLGAGLPAARASASQLRQVVMNLVTNAAEAIVEGLGEICISTDLVKLAGDAAARLPKGDYLKLQVSDTGVGMTPDVQTRIFDPFFSTKEAGRGLGLAVVHGIIRTHGGAITVTSEPHKGTKFEILLPCVTTPLPRTI
jgi:signal transduction histidine kinase